MAGKFTESQHPLGSFNRASECLTDDVCLEPSHADVNCRDTRYRKFTIQFVLSSPSRLIKSLSNFLYSQPGTRMDQLSGIMFHGESRFTFIESSLFALRFGRRTSSASNLNDTAQWKSASISLFPFPPFAMIYSHHDSDYPSSPGTIEAEFMPRSASCGVGGRKKGFLRHQQLTQSGELSEKYQLI